MWRPFLFSLYKIFKSVLILVMFAWGDHFKRGSKMSKRKRGERNWIGEEGDERHIFPTSKPDDFLEHTYPNGLPEGIVLVHGHPCIRAADGKLERIDE